MSIQSADPLQSHLWTRQPQAEALLKGAVADFLARCPAASALAVRMRDETGTRFFDWIDHLVLPLEADIEQRLVDAGFARQTRAGAKLCFVHEGGMFPAVLVERGAPRRVAIKVESVADFLAAQGLSVPIEGAPLAEFRRVKVASGDGAELWAVERHGYRGFEILRAPGEQALKRLRHLELFRTRRREFSDDAQGFDEAEWLVKAAIADLGRDLTTDLFFAAEREYWQRRNRAARAQKARQDALGLGWANHDHHTYRSSRRWFSRLIEIFELLGFHCRERFYAGADAGWGAQVLEQPTAGVVIFADVDLSPEELRNDFSHEPLPPRDRLGTVGLWCGLHGEAFLQAGMHHLECQFDFEALKQQLETSEGIAVMKPFTDFSYLRQAFTEGERWPVREERIAKLLSEGLITEQQAKQFREHGAIGSHLENLERNEGFKGFNQKGVSEIIAKTDPRKQMVESVK